MKNIELINKLKEVQEIMYDEPDKALEIVKSIKIKDADKEDLYEITMITADVLYYADQFDRAIEYYEKALKIPIKGRKDEAKCYCHIGSCYYEKGYYLKAIEKLETALKYTSDNKLIKKIYKWLVLAYKDNQEFDKCIKTSKKLIEMLMKQYPYDATIRDDIANAYIEISMCYWQLHDEENSEKYFNMVINETGINPHIIAWAYAIKAHRLFENKNWNEALIHYKKAISLTDSEDNKKEWQEYIKLCSAKI